MVKIECKVCENIVKVDKWGNAQCKFCGWIESENSTKYSNLVKYPNITSLVNAKKLYNEHKKLKPTYDEFITMVEENLEPNFTYKHKRYGCTCFDGYEFFECGVEKGYQNYFSLEDFAKKVSINGILLKDLWDEITDFEINA